MTSPALPESNTSLTYTQPSSQPHLTHTPLQPLRPNEILVKVKAAAINPVDIQLWGNPVVGWLAGKKEKGIGRDYSGEVIAVGEEVQKSGKWAVGDEVYGLCNRAVSRVASFLDSTVEEPIDSKHALPLPNFDQDNDQHTHNFTPADRRRNLHPVPQPPAPRAHRQKARLAPSPSRRRHPAGRADSLRLPGLAALGVAVAQRATPAHRRGGRQRRRGHVGRAAGEEAVQLPRDGRLLGT